MEWFQSPMLLVLKLTVPVVDDEDEEMKGWNRHLNSLQCFTGPTFFIFATDREPGFCHSLGMIYIPNQLHCPRGIYPMGNLGCFPRGKTAATETRYPTNGACWMF